MSDVEPPNLDDPNLAMSVGEFVKWRYGTTLTADQCRELERDIRAAGVEPVDEPTKVTSERENGGV